MSGYCDDCGNTICVCANQLLNLAIERLGADNERLREAIMRVRPTVEDRSWMAGILDAALAATAKEKP